MSIIYDPRNPPRFLDGLLDVYSTCRDCGTLMKVIRAEDHSHPCCTVVQTSAESLADLYAAELKAGDHEQAELTAQLMETESQLIDLQSAAIEYAQWFWPVFPLSKHGKAPAIKGGNGFKDAHTDVERITKYWRKRPDCNIGLATGHYFDVIDVDTKDSKGNPTTAGINSFMQLLEHGDLPECHGVAVTASGGLHLYVKTTGRGNFAGVRPGIDYRGKGGYVVAPPSTLGRPGKRWTWLVEPSPIIKGDY